ncbi:MAG: ribonuclease III [Leptolyngbyaceae cyanobacterium bins.302]|nr:ribonuclease III [Leptolyngbyaceae cyanobacterium bins.302]
MLQQALTHRSHTNERNSEQKNKEAHRVPVSSSYSSPLYEGVFQNSSSIPSRRRFGVATTELFQDNERLEFLGDAILNFLSGEFLYKKYPEKTEGELTTLRAMLVDTNQLAEFAKMLDLGDHLHLGRGAEQGGARKNPRILGSAFEAVIGAYFLERNSNIHEVRSYVLPFFELVVEKLSISVSSVSLNNSKIEHRATKNYKSQLQEWALAKHGTNPSYVVVKESGPDHAKTFVIEVQVKGESYGQGSGRKKQDAEKDAARDALERLGLL